MTQSRRPVLHAQVWRDAQRIGSWLGGPSAVGSPRVVQPREAEPVARATCYHQELTWSSARVAEGLAEQSRVVIPVAKDSIADLPRTIAVYQTCTFRVSTY